MRPIALDLFCGAGGASMGLYRAGFDVIGVDIKPQPRYPFAFIQADAMTFDLAGFDFIWASPPCQGYTTINHRWNVQRSKHPLLLDPVRSRLRESGAPYAIENVETAPLINPVTLCGSYFGLAVRRHRKVETNFAVTPIHCKPLHIFQPIAVYGDHPERHLRRPGKGGFVNRAHTLQHSRDAMDIYWMEWKKLTQAVPPIYAEYIAAHVL